MRTAPPPSSPLRPRVLGALGLFAVLLAGVALRAQGTGEAAAAPETEGETMLSLVLRGGWLMVPIGICSAVVLTYAIERAISLRAARSVPDGLLAELFSTLPPERVNDGVQTEAVRSLDASRSLLGRVLREGVAKLHRGRSHTETVLAEAGARQVHLLERRLRPFAVVETLAPLLGLLGTVYGMITCFEHAAATDASSRAETLARGIYGALVTTAAGLTVAIPAKVLFHYFEGRVDRIVDRLEEAATEVLEFYFADAPEPAARTGGVTAGGTAGEASQPERSRPIARAMRRDAGT